MATDVEIFKELEKQLGKKLRQATYRIGYEIEEGYTIDENENI